MTGPSDSTPIDEKKFVALKPEEVPAVFSSAIASQSRLLVWTQNQRFTVVTRVMSFLDQAPNLYIACPLDDPEADFQRKLDANGIKDCYFSLSLPTDLIFFQGELKRADKGLLHFRVADSVYKVQRRKSLRLPIPESLGLYLSGVVGSVSWNARILDISEGGLALLIEANHVLSLMQEKESLVGVTFRIRNREIRTNVVVAHRKEIRSPRIKEAMKIGLSFDGLSSEDRDLITSFVFEESSKFFGRIE